MSSGRASARDPATIAPSVGAIARKWREITSTHPNDKGSVIVDARELNALCLAVLDVPNRPEIPDGSSTPGDGGFPVRRLQGIDDTRRA